MWAAGYCLSGGGPGGDDGRPCRRHTPGGAVELELELFDPAACAEEEVAQRPAVVDLAVEQRAKRHAALLVETDVLQQQERRLNRDLLVAQLRRAVRQEADRLVAAEHDETERLPGREID